MLTKKQQREFLRIIRPLRSARMDHLEDRVALRKRIDQCVERGKVAIVYGGVDCDMARWDNRVAIVQAIPMAVVKWEQNYHDNAEGPQWTRLSKPSRAPKKSSSRDLALEAFEDGHAHVVYL